MSDPDERRFERVASETAWTGRLVHVTRDRYRYPDGEEVEREIIRHPGAAGIVAHDDLHVWLVRQPREAVGDPDVLEIPAGKLDVPGEPALACAQRELAEEVGKSAERWAPILAYATSLGVMDEIVHLFHATDLRDAHALAEENERIEVVAWPLDDLDRAIEATIDSKTVIGLMWLREHLRREHLRPPGDDVA
ncbi:MAG: NUDIX hydrolase [Solirubrobacteraceae bacterium]|jgi:ADP-ribose pyrophosphatase|nr:NUDIX hydrolase [Solirubrobacteraceae bacterium]